MSDDRTSPIPPPSTPTSAEEQARQARLARLAQRRAANGGPPPQRSAAPRPAEGPAGTWAAPASAGSSQPGRLAPPPPPPGARVAARTAPVAGSAPAKARGKRRHPAKGARFAALGMSVATTAGLAAAFASAQQPGVALTTLDPSTAAAATPVAQGSTGTAATAASTGAAGSTATSGTAAASGTAATSTASSGTAAATTSGGTAAAKTTTTTTAYADGTYTGTTFTNRWGPVQVKVTISKGAITDVTALQVPTGGKNDTINARAVPVLRTEAITAQSASIAVVSGATYTSQSYKQSLQSALDQATAATHAA